MNKYIIMFSKTGTICYTSHLDMMKMFKRAFKRAGIALNYSEGFNPHPKMGFAQPLSLGYWGMKELLEFETQEEYDCAFVEETLRKLMPEGVEILQCCKGETGGKTLAARTEAAEYMISIPLNKSLDMTSRDIYDAYMGQERIVALKKQKKKKELAEIDIKPMIRKISFTAEDGTLFVNALLDSGSSSNLSPELVITTLIKTLELPVEREQVQVMRKRMIFAQRMG